MSSFEPRDILYKRLTVLGAKFCGTTVLNAKVCDCLSNYGWCIKQKQQLRARELQVLNMIDHYSATTRGAAITDQGWNRNMVT